MAHAIVEYSANLEEKIDLKGLVDEVHDACIKTGVFPLLGMRTRAARRETYKIADGNSDACFVHLQLKLGPGREEAIKKKAMEEIFESLTLYVKSLYDTSPGSVGNVVYDVRGITHYYMNLASRSPRGPHHQRGGQKTHAHKDERTHTTTTTMLQCSSM